MAKSHDNPSSEPVTKADLNALKTEVIEAVQATVKGLATKDDLNALATQEALTALTTTVNTVTETVAELKEGMTELKGLMKDVVQELTTTHEDVRYLRRSMDMLVRNDAAQDTAIKTLTARVARLERKVGITK
jgi:predicted RNase H-like nuclease (RuvC/YqgF family)